MQAVAWRVWHVPNDWACKAESYGKCVWGSERAGQYGHQLFKF